MDFFYKKIENKGPAAARIGIKGHAPLSQFLNSSFILQLRKRYGFRDEFENNLHEEVADTLICIAELVCLGYLDIDKVINWQKQKIDREVKRAIQKEEELRKEKEEKLQKGEDIKTWNL